PPPCGRSVIALLALLACAGCVGAAAAFLGGRRLASGSPSRLDHAGGVAAVLGPAPASRLSHRPRSVVRSRSHGVRGRTRAGAGLLESPPGPRAEPGRQARRRPRTRAR